MKIRKLRASDAETVGNVYLNAMGQNVDNLKFYRGFNEYIHFFSKTGYSYVISYEEKIFGVILAMEMPDMFNGKRVYIEIFTILPEYQEKGYGKKLLEKVYKKATDNGIFTVTLYASCYLDSYEKYKKMGYIDLRADRRYMQKSLKGL